MLIEHFGRRRSLSPFEDGLLSKEGAEHLRYHWNTLMRGVGYYISICWSEAALARIGTDLIRHMEVARPLHQPPASLCGKDLWHRLVTPHNAGIQ